MNSQIVHDFEEIIELTPDLDLLRGKSVLITGGHGMLLTHTTMSLCQYNTINADRPIRILLVVRNVDRAIHQLSQYGNVDSIEFIESDLLEPLHLAGEVNYIIHGAGHGHAKDFAKIADLITSNVIGTYNLLNLAKEKQTSVFLFMSSGAVYGDNENQEVVDETFVGRLDHNNLGNLYGESKRISEQMARVYQLKYGIQVKFMRPANIYGPSMKLDEDTRIFPSFIANIINKTPLYIRSDGLDRRSFCHVVDFTTGLFKVLFHGQNGESYNISNEDFYMTINELAGHFVLAFPGTEIVHLNTKCRTSFDKILLSSKKLRSLGWFPRIAIAEGIKRTVACYS